MKELRVGQRVISVFVVLGLAVLAVLNGLAATAASGRTLLGGTWGVVRSVKGEPIEGMGVQLISAKTAIRTTVYSDMEGRYEFPKLDAGVYTLRITRPLEYRPYQNDSVSIDGATRLDDIVLERVSNNEYLPPTPEILAQLAGVEWVMNLPGTGQEKRVFSIGCGFGCHSYQQIFRNRYDEDGWRLILQRMLRGAGSPLIHINRQPLDTPQAREQIPMRSVPSEEIITKWLARVRGPEAKDDVPLYVLPRPRGESTRVIVTEYELPRTLLAPHDVHGDSKGNIWYTPHRSPYVGALNPRTGEVKEYRPPDIPDVLPGTHRVWVDEKDIVWLSENWSQHLTRLDPKTGEFQRFPLTKYAGNRHNASGFYNFGMDREGYVYHMMTDGAEGPRQPARIDSKTGKIVQRYKMKSITSTYDNIISDDGRYWAGGMNSGNLLGLIDLKTGESWEIETKTLWANTSRGGFDREGNAWFGGRGGMLLKLDPKTRRVTEYWPPIPYATFYEAMPDKNGEIWAAALGSGRFLRFNPRTEHWIEYLLPEPFSHDRRTWIDNSTDPVTVWYVDHNGYMVRIQPLE
ncbi:MAG: carboxypeptidase regulatory-like domain-containing protein [Acidobacteria bacterium]|nr:carboxypeptidase regulatory-like domain-containing protein [Acidobacteriota bacterium]